MIISSRANTIILVAILAVGIAIVAMLATGARGGPLDPPAAPASTDGVREPGTPISSLPFAISQPGRYYLTRNLSLGSGNAITIGASDVLLDLGGFTIDGLGTNTLSAVYDLGVSKTNVSVEHGTIRGFQFGLVLGTTAHGHITGVQVIGVLSGTAIQTQFEGTLEDCDVSGGNAGVVLAELAVMRRCHIHDLAGFGVHTDLDSVVEDSVIDLVATRGVDVSTGTGASIRNNRFRANGPGHNADVVVTTGVASVIDNDIDCTTSVSATGTGQVVTSTASGAHPNVPLFAGPTFC